MGIIIRQNNQIIYYLKGADSVMQSKISQADAHFMAEACLDLAKEGLRTLVVAQKALTEDCTTDIMKITRLGKRN